MQNSYSSSTGTKFLDATKSDSCTGMETGLRVQAVGSLVLRYGLVLVIGWIGLMKFTEYEAKGIQPLVAHSPLMSWMYDFSRDIRRWGARSFQALERKFFKNNHLKVGISARGDLNPVLGFCIPLFSMLFPGEFPSG